MSINPNDPVVSILQKAVSELRQEVLNETTEIGQALEVFAQSVAMHLAKLGSRVAVLETRVSGAAPDAPVAAEARAGVEL